MARTIAPGIVLLLAATSVYAQVNASVTGVVADPSGAVIPGSQVTATNANTGIVTNVESNATGNYTFQSLQPGSYRISSAFQGFQTQTLENVNLTQGASVRLNFTLTPASAATTLEVVADAATLLEETSASIENTLQERTVLNLPVQTRNVLDLVATTPGVVVQGGGFGPTVRLSGTSAGSVNTTRDGLTTNDGRYNESNGVYSAIFTSPDMVEEVQVSTNSIDAAAGRGSGQVSMRTRQGTNEFHGALFYTNNNSALSSRDFFEALQGAERSYENRNQFGGRLGGPIVRNKAFFFVLIDQQRYLTRQLTTAPVLTPEARQGNFRYLTTNSVGGGSRQNGNALSGSASVDLAGNVLTSANGIPLFLNSFNVFTDVNDPNRTGIDQTWVQPQFINRQPLPNNYAVGDGLNVAGYQWLRRQEGTDGATGNSPNPNRDHLTTRFDWQVNDNHRLTYTMSREANKGVTGQTGLAAFPGAFFGAVERNPDFYTASWSAVLTPTILNEFRYGLKRDDWRGTGALDSGYDFEDANNVDELAQEARNSFPQGPNGFYYIQEAANVGATYADLNASTPRKSTSPLNSFSDTLNFSTGAHSFQAGFEMNRFSSDQDNSGGATTTRPYSIIGNGAFPVAGITPDNFPGLNTNDLDNAEDLLNQLAGSIGTLQQQYFIITPTQTDWSDYRDDILFNRNIQQNDWVLFFKDTWKATQNLTLNFGLRYDKYGTPYDSAGLGGRFAGGQRAAWSISGTSFADAQWAPGVMNGDGPTATEFVSKNSPNPDLTIFNDDWNNFAPSVGFSYNVPTFGRATIFRGGYGINFSGAADFLDYSFDIGNIPGGTLNPQLTPQSYLDVATVANSGLFPISDGGAVPFSPVPIDSPTGRSVGVDVYSDERPVPYVQSFNFAIQHEIAQGLTVEVGWVGNKATKLYGLTEINDANIFETGLLEAFNMVRAGGESELLDRMLNGIPLTNNRSQFVIGQNITAAQELRANTATNTMLANGLAGDLADFLNFRPGSTGENGGLLRNSGLFPENFFVPNPQFDSVQLEGNIANSTYHSLQLIVNQRYQHGFSWQFSYVWSKNLGIDGQRHPRDINLGKSIMDQNRQHLLKLNGVWDLPFGSNGYLGRNLPGYIDRVIGGWTLSPVVQWASGSPLGFITALATISDAFGNNNTPVVIDGNLLKHGDGAVRVDGRGFVEYFAGYSTPRAPFAETGAVSSLQSRFTNRQLVDPNGNLVAQLPGPGEVGTVSPNNFGSLAGPGQLTFNASLSKRIDVTESMYFTLRADVINVLNKPQWGNPNSNVNSNNFGRIASASGDRTVTINARFDF